MTKVEFYHIGNLHGAYAAKQGDNYWIVPTARDGWSQRRPWNVDQSLKNRFCTRQNRVTFYGHAWHAEIVVGISKDLVAVIKP